MNKENFASFIEGYMNTLGAINALSGIGLDITYENSTFPIESFVDQMFEQTLNMLFEEPQIDIINSHLFGEDSELDIDKLFDDVQAYKN